MSIFKLNRIEKIVWKETHCYIMVTEYSLLNRRQYRLFLEAKMANRLRIASILVKYILITFNLLTLLIVILLIGRIFSKDRDTFYVENGGFIFLGCLIMGMSLLLSTNSLSSIIKYFIMQLYCNLVINTRELIMN